MRTPSPLRRLARSDRGAILVEFALVLPLLLALFAVTIEGARLMWSFQTALAGVRDATRYVGRIVSTDICPSSLPSSSTYETRMAAIVRDQLGGGSVLPQQVALDTSGGAPVTVAFSCVTGDYRVSPAPIATVSARVRVNFPFEGIFDLVGGIDPYVVTTITDRTRVFGS